MKNDTVKHTKRKESKNVDNYTLNIIKVRNPGKKNNKRPRGETGDINREGG